jgi:hypothetical protein
MKSYIMSPNVYPGIFLFLVGKNDVDEIKRLCKKHKLWNGEGSLESSSSYGSCWNFGTHSCLWINSFKLGNPDDHATLIHEVIHAVSNHAESIGIKLSRESEEHFCYMSGWLTAGFINAVKNKLFK